MKEARDEDVTAFECYPEDWIARTICVYGDGTYALHESYVGQERFSAGHEPVDRLVIQNDTRPATVRAFLVRALERAEKKRTDA